MNTSGIIRKIDDLGRIVLPKELRKHLNINPGEDFQIFLDNEKIILERYSYLKNHQNEIINIIKSFCDVTNIDFKLIINNKIVTNNNEIINDEIINIINERKIYIEEDIEDHLLFNNYKENGKIIIYPIVINSDLYGAIIVISNSDSKRIIEYIKIIIDIIKKYYM